MIYSVCEKQDTAISRDNSISKFFVPCIYSYIFIEIIYYTELIRSNHPTT